MHFLTPFILCLLPGTIHAFSLSQLITTNTTHAGNSLSQQNLAVAPPFPILQVALEHILGQWGENATEAENATIAGRSTATPGSTRRSDLSTFVPLRERGAPAQCSPTSPCADASCCNSEGKCGFTPYNCNNTAATTCISNCDATAMCGVDSLHGEQKCPLNICCSYFGYCGTSSVFCQPRDAAGTVKTPCQEGYGKCAIISPPSCGGYSASASNGRKMAYYQAANVRYRTCNRIQPSQIDTDGLTHLILTFAAIDPVSFKVTPTDPSDTVLYSQFSALKTPLLQTWISIGGFDFNNPGPTFTTWSDMCGTEMNRAAFIASLIEFMDTWGFQGVDIDWEYPTLAARGGRPGDTANLCSLMEEMRAAFGTKYGISIVLPPDFVYLAGFDPKGMEPHVDFYNYMSYDLHGPWEASTLGAWVRSQTSILDINSTMLPLWFDGLNPAKINLGIAYYGRGFTLSNPSCQLPGCAYSGPSAPGRCTNSAGLLSLREIENVIIENDLVPLMLPDLMIKQIVWDDNQWMGYDDNDTIALKTQWANENCLGGTVIWSIDFNSGPGSGDVPLVPTTNGQCGSGVTCAGSPYGECCSTYGWCGSGPSYCSASTCQPAFGMCHTDSAILSVSQTGACGNGVTCQGSTFGNCCSKQGYCGSTAEYCSLTGGCQSLFGSCGLPVSIDGSCGNGVGCQGSAFGDCCSQYGYCGRTDAYCALAEGCQAGFGTCQ